jgi:hypothetical protein
MKPRRSFLNIVLFAILLFQYIPISNVQAGGRLDPPLPPVIAYNDETGMVSFVGSPDGNPIPVPGADKLSLQATDRAGVICQLMTARLPSPLRHQTAGSLLPIPAHQTLHLAFTDPE